ncbi:hypothetical protein PUG81_28110 [Erwiniaceae bacterium L1_54_6]|jgi:hypothetical protein|nr:hypothetical protein [Erwiniaceae bacterium L1_54_6]
MQEISARVLTANALVLISLLLWSYVCCLSIDYFLPAEDARERARQSMRLRRAVLMAALMSLATLLLLLPG